MNYEVEYVMSIGTSIRTIYVDDHLKVKDGFWVTLHGKLTEDVSIGYAFILPHMINYILSTENYSLREYK